jgi:hypothetical protein
MELSGTVRLILIVAAAILLAFLALQVIHVISTIVGWLITIVVFGAIVYAVYWLARSSLRKGPNSKGA